MVQVCFAVGFDRELMARNVKKWLSAMIRGDRPMDSKPAQNIQDTFLNTVRKDKSPITIYLVSGVKLTGKIRSFDKYSVLLENNAQEQLIFKHAISTVVSGRPMGFGEIRAESRAPSAVPAESPLPATGTANS
jgi:host factor-I protein